MNPSVLKQIVTEARPLIEQQLDLAEQIAGLREVVTANGGDWSQLKALVKAQVQDERDEAGDGKHVRKILDRAEYANAYADILGFGGAKMNEFKSFSDDLDPETGEVVDTSSRFTAFVQTAIGGEVGPSLAGAESEADRQPIPEHTTAPGDPASAGAAVDATPSPRSLSQEAA